MEWLLAPVDPARAHHLDLAAAWHGRLMVLAWAVLLPIGVLIARFLKIKPKQDWPRERDSKLWFRTHVGMQCVGAGCMAAALWLIASSPMAGGPGAVQHKALGWAISIAALAQLGAFWLRGSKGGPLSSGETTWGDHYNMSRRRRTWEICHKLFGYLALLLAVATIFSGMWMVNGPRWMFLLIGVWWCLVFAAFALLQRRGLAYDTYQAIWGPDASHPGNAMRPIGFGIRRRGE